MWWLLQSLFDGGDVVVSTFAEGFLVYFLDSVDSDLLTALSGCGGIRRVAGRAVSFGILLAMITDGSSC